MLQQWAITNDRLGLGKSTPKLTVATATAGNGGSTPVAALPEPKKIDANGSATSSNAIANDTEANNAPDKAKEARRRRAKRR
jgi:hypothetical protein